MSVQQLERSLARLKMETDEKYDALWKRYTKEKEQDQLRIAYLLNKQEIEKKIAEVKAEQREIEKAKDNYIAEQTAEQNKMRDIILLSHFNSFRQMDNAGETGFTLIAKDLREALVSGQTDCGCQQQKTHRITKDAFEGLFRIITERRTPSKQDVENVRTIREGLISNGIIDA